MANRAFKPENALRKAEGMIAHKLLSSLACRLVGV